jgi:hypothetical protein
MAAHIFTVNETTFNVHLNYMFAGTGKDGAAHQVGALVDISSIREGDVVFFYVMNKGFYGTFMAVNQPFYESNETNYLNESLDGKTLTYRIKIEPLEVYQRGKSEWDVIENPELIKDQSIYNLQWGWIFKKLNANRGCLAIDNFEFELLNKIVGIDNVLLVKCNSYSFVDGIIVPNDAEFIYEGDMQVALRNNLNIIRIEEDLRLLIASEANNNSLLDIVLKPETNGKINFISNEVLCSFSERRLDLVLGTDNETCLLIELKNEFIFEDSIYFQIKEYSRWVSAYKLQYEKIIPILIIREARILSERRGSLYFKYLSTEEKERGETSPWYNGVIESIEVARASLREEGFPRLEDLQVYVFDTNELNELLNFNQIF